VRAAIRFETSANGNPQTANARHETGQDEAAGEQKVSNAAPPLSGIAQKHKSSIDKSSLRVMQLVAPSFSQKQKGTRLSGIAQFVGVGFVRANPERPLPSACDKTHH
jgi:hypothetical protein